MIFLILIQKPNPHVCNGLGDQSVSSRAAAFPVSSGGRLQQRPERTIDAAARAVGKFVGGFLLRAIQGFWRPQAFGQASLWKSQDEGRRRKMFIAAPFR
jgi:hypothetical protein